MKFCVDCEHCGPNESYQNRTLCESPRFLNLITGNKLSVECSEARRRKFTRHLLLESWGYETCGPDAQYFEAKK